MQIGQKVLHLTSVDSTNNYAANLLKRGELVNGTVILADDQFAGRGQRNTKWQSNPSENLTISFFLDDVNLSVDRQFVLTQLVTLGLLHFFEKEDIEAVIKWPNDIYVGNRKIAGVLIENQLRGNQVQSAIVGIGINVNQKGFDGLTATSIFNETGAFSSITEQMFSLIHSMNEVFARHKSDFTTLKEMYETHLYRKNVRAKFEDVHGKFTGVIQGTTDQGELIVLRDNQQEQTYSLKEISFIF